MQSPFCLEPTLERGNWSCMCRFQRSPLHAKFSVAPCRGGEGLLRRLFEPLGYEVEASRVPLDEKFPEWGESRRMACRSSRQFLGLAGTGFGSTWVS